MLQLIQQAITFLAGGFYLVGRGLDEVFNPRLRKR
jgi:ABC-type dipeptide/oligopeptide/nickel transport system permease subunit